MRDEPDSSDPRLEALVRQSRWITISEPDWFVDDVGPTKGNREKAVMTAMSTAVCPSGDIRRYFWKESLRRYPLEFWSEVLASQIAAICKVAAVETWPARWESGEFWRYGSLSKFLIDADDEKHPEVLIEGGDLLAFLKPDYERKRGTDHSLQLCAKLFSKFDASAARPDFASFIRQLIFDGLIGNTDRHQDNWAIGVKRMDNVGSRLRLLPAFDNGTSFGRELTEEKLADMERDVSILDRYIARGTAHMRWESGGGLQDIDGAHRWVTGNLEEVNHEMLLARTLNSFPDLRPVFDRVLSFDQAQVSASIARVAALSREPICPENLAITPVREKFLVRSVLRRRDRLRQVLFDP